MLRRLQHVNIPTDVLRTVVTIIDLGSFGKAGERLGLSQPAISAQIKRLQLLVGGEIFARSGTGVVLNARGTMLAPMIRNMLATNDQMLQIGGAAHDPRPLRIGLSYMYGNRFLADNDARDLRKLTIVCDHSAELLRSLADGYLDICVTFEPTSEAGQILHRWEEQAVWVRSPDFTLSPGEPVPLVGWPGMLGDRITINALERRGIAYRFACTSNEDSCRVAAVAAGWGVMIRPAWDIPQGLVEAREYYLPSIPPVEAGIVKGRTVEISAMKSIVKMLSPLMQAKAAADGPETGDQGNGHQ